MTDESKMQTQTTIELSVKMRGARLAPKFFAPGSQYPKAIVQREFMTKLSVTQQMAQTWISKPKQTQSKTKKTHIVESTCTLKQPQQMTSNYQLNTPADNDTNSRGFNKTSQLCLSYLPISVFLAPPMTKKFYEREAAQAHEGDIWSHISNTYFAPFRACTHDVSLLALDVPTCLITASPAKATNADTISSNESSTSRTSTLPNISMLPALRVPQLPIPVQASPTPFSYLIQAAPSTAFFRQRLLAALVPSLPTGLPLRDVQPTLIYREEREDFRRAHSERLTSRWGNIRALINSGLLRKTDLDERSLEKINELQAASEAGATRQPNIQPHQQQTNHHQHNLPSRIQSTNIINSTIQSPNPPIPSSSGTSVVLGSSLNSPVNQTVQQHYSRTWLNVEDNFSARAEDTEIDRTIRELTREHEAVILRTNHLKACLLRSLAHGNLVELEAKEKAEMQRRVDENAQIAAAKESLKRKHISNSNNGGHTSKKKS